VYNRPFDDKEQLTVRMEAEAKLKIQEEIRNGAYELVWSYMNGYENNDNPYADKRESIQIWEHIAKYIRAPDEKILKRGTTIQLNNIKPKDSLHLSCAVESECQYFITTDIQLIKKAKLFSEIKIINPIDFIRETEEEHGSGH
jgi:predicted nucleic acid-binding protein